MRLFSSGQYLTIEDNHALLASIRYSPGAWLKNHSLHPQSLKPVISQKAFFSTLLRSGPAKKQVEMVILVALAYIGTLTGKKMRERKEEKAASYRPQINQGRR